MVSGKEMEEREKDGGGMYILVVGVFGGDGVELCNNRDLLFDGRLQLGDELRV